MKRAVLAILALTGTCAPSPEVSTRLQLALSAAGIDRASLVEVRFLPSDDNDVRTLSLSPETFWRTFESAGPGEPWCSCNLGRLLLISVTSKPEAAAEIRIHDEGGMRLKVRGRRFEFEAPELRVAVQRALTPS